MKLSVGDMPTMDDSGFRPIGRIDRYELIAQLGAGGFGSVYHARDSVALIDVAIKVLPPMISAIPEELENVRANFAIVSKLHHPNIGTLLHLHKVDKPDVASQELLRVFPGSFLVVMEYVQGSTLSNWKKQFPDKKVPYEKAVEICAKVADALDFAHFKQIIHRDIKPSNIMITNNNEVKVLDFGLAAEIRSSMSRVSKEQMDTSGTRPYMAPEQWTGKGQGSATDQYALACMFYELVSGKVPFQSVFESGDTILMMNLVKTEAPEPIVELFKKQNSVLLMALSKDPQERFANCADFLAALREGKPRKTQETHTKGGFNIRLVAVVVLLLLATGGYFGYQRYEKNNKVEMKRVATEKATKNEQIRQAAHAQQRQDKIKSLKSKVESSERAGNLADASKYVSEILSLDPQNSYAKETQRKISEKAGLAKASPVKSRAEVAFKSVSSEQGFKSKIAALKAKLKTANTFYNAKSYNNAMAKYQEIIAESGKLAELVRKKRTAKANTRLKLLKKRREISKTPQTTTNPVSPKKNKSEALWMDAIRAKNRNPPVPSSTSKTVHKISSANLWLKEMQKKSKGGE